ncbi:hypothetical protein [Pontimicrobium sp. MEBiC01747]
MRTNIISEPSLMMLNTPCMFSCGEGKKKKCCKKYKKKGKSNCKRCPKVK